MVVESSKLGNFSSFKDGGGENSAASHPPQTQQHQPHRENPTRVRRPDRAVYVPRARRTVASSTSITPSPPAPDSLQRISPDLQACSSKSTDYSTPQPVTPNASRKEEKISVTPKTKRSIDRNFCNVYKPPHARFNESNERNVNFVDGESLPRTKSCESSRKVPRVTIADDIVPKFECTQTLLVNNSEKDRSAIDSALDCAIDSSIDYVNNLMTPPKNISQRSLLDNNIVENGVDNFVDIVSNLEHTNNATNDSQEHLSSSDFIDGTNTSSQVDNNILLSCNGDLDSEKSFDYILQPVPDLVVNSQQNPSIIMNSNNENAWNNDKDEDKDEKELKKASEEINRSNRRLIKQSFVSDVLIISDPTSNKRQNSPDTSANCEEFCNTENNKNAENDIDKTKVFNPDEEDWEAIIDENGEWLPPQLMEELTSTVGKVAIQKPRTSYSKYQTAAPQAFSHVLEIYDFPSAFTTNDLLSVLSDFKDTGFEIKWVDDNHALGVFSSTEIAAEVLAYNHPMVKTRPLHEATHESRMKAKKCAEFLQPYRPRPETCMALARRLVTSALGVRLPTQSQERLQEKEKISLAREKKRLAAKHREAAWDGSLGES